MRGLVILTVLAAWAGTGHADDVLPSLTLQADPTGQGAKLKAGFDYLLHSPAGSLDGPPFSATVSPFFQATTTGGVATLLAIDSKEASASSSWDVGAVLSTLTWPNRDYAAVQRGYPVLASLQYGICAAYCVDPVPVPAKSFCDARQVHRKTLEADALEKRADGKVRDPDLTEALQQRAAVAHGDSAKDLDRRLTRLLDDRIRELVTEKELCPQARAAMHAYDLERYDPWLAGPTRILAVGASLGATVDKFLQPGDLSLTPLTRTHSTQTLAFQLVKQSRGLTFELPVLARRRFELATSRTARWCVSAGTVQHDGASTPAEACEERPIGPLARRYSVQLGALFGAFNPRGFWRISAGPVISLSSRADGEAAVPYRVGFVVPLQVATSLLKADAKILARLTVGIFRSRSVDGSHDTSFAFTLALLSSPTLFASPFDQL